MKYTVVLLISLFGGTAFAQDLQPQDALSAVRFQIENFGLTVEGSFKGLSGTIRFKPDELSIAYFEVSVKTDKIDTGIGMRDDHLRKEEYFHVEKYPEINFKSDKITSRANGEFQVEGVLSIKGVSKKVAFPFTAVESAGGITTFKGSFSINRRDFGVGGRSMSMADELRVLLSVSAKPTP